MKIDNSWLLNKKQRFLAAWQRLYPVFKRWWISDAATPGTLRLDILLRVSKFLGARTENAQTDKSLQSPVLWTLTGLATLQTLSYQPCIVRHVFPAKKYRSSHLRGGGFAPRVFTPSPSPIPSPVEQQKDEPELTELCQTHHPQPGRCAGTAGLLGAVLFHQRPHRRDASSGSLPGWAAS